MAVGDLVNERGFSDQIIATAFQFYNERDNNQSSFIVYDYKSNKFYPFVPVDHTRKTRNNTEEMKIMETIADEIPLRKTEICGTPSGIFPCNKNKILPTITRLLTSTLDYNYNNSILQAQYSPIECRAWTLFKNLKLKILAILRPSSYFCYPANPFKKCMLVILVGILVFQTLIADRRLRYRLSTIAVSSTNPESL